MRVRPTRYAVNNKRMAQAMRHAGVRAVATSPSRVTLCWEDGLEGEDGEDPLHALIHYLEPNSVNGHEHMPSVDEARALGLLEEDEK
jgi:hypothetical protein